MSADADNASTSVNSGPVENAKSSGGPSGRSLLLDYVDKRVGVITNDGRLVVGRLRGFDQVCNIVLDTCFERIFSTDQGAESVDHGVYVIRGDNM